MFAVWQETRTLIAREHFLQLLYPIYWLPKSQTLIAGEMLWFAKTQTFIAANISWSTVPFIFHDLCGLHVPRIDCQPCATDLYWYN